MLAERKLLRVRTPKLYLGIGRDMLRQCRRTIRTMDPRVPPCTLLWYLLALSRLIPRRTLQENTAMTEFVSPTALSERTLLRELNHRISNEFTSAINFVSVAAVRTDNAEVKSALNHVVELLHQYADVHRALKMPDRNAVVDAAEYLRTLCHSISRSKLDRMGIRLVLAADTVWLHSERCWKLGMIVYELVTNVARHACFQAGDAEVQVELSRTGAFARCVVSDNGSAAGGGVRPGRGLKIISDLAESLGGEVGHSFGVNGVSFTLAVPFVGREQPANRRRRMARSIGTGCTEGLHHAQQ